MIRGVRLLPNAAADVAEAQLFYEAQSEGLGQYFRRVINSEMRSLLVHGGVHRKQYGFHRCLSKGFPFAIFYRLRGETIGIYAVLDCRRDPDEIRALLHER